MKETSMLKMAMDYRSAVDALLGENDFPDLILTNARIINVITREIYPGDLAIKNGYILLVGDCRDLAGPRTRLIDLEGRYVSPGFIDSHMHFESSMLTVTEFSRLSIPSGTTTLVADPHEIGNALGPVGMKAMADEIDHVPSNVYLVVPALIPDSPSLETAGYDLSSKDMEDLLNYPNIIGIGELQGFSNAQHVYDHTPEVITDLIGSTIYARSKNMVVDGNAPELFGKELAAHIIASGGECSCHETTTKAEAVEKLRQGIYLFMREGSTQKNMGQCIKAVTEEGMDSRRCILATDDMVAGDLRTLGHMNEIIRRTIKEGVDPVEAIQMATINPASYFGFKHVGVLAPGKQADIAIIDDLNEMTVAAVFLKGDLVAANKELLIDLGPYTYPEEVKNSVKIGPISQADLEIRSEKNEVLARCIEVIPDQNLTGQEEHKLRTRRNIVEADPERDILHIACVERYNRSGKIGKAFVTGFGMREGAFAESVAHDTHNIMVVGSNLEDMTLAVNRVIEMGGGIAIANKSRILGEMKLGVGGLITDELNGHEVSEKIEELENIIRKDLGCRIHAPLMHLSFLALSTSPSWKITDKGLIDVNNFKILSPIVE